MYVGYSRDFLNFKFGFFTHRCTLYLAFIKRMKKKKISVTHGIIVLGYTAIQIGSLGQDQNRPGGYSDDVTSSLILFVYL
jgi:hypothetical protein